MNLGDLILEMSGKRTAEGMRELVKYGRGATTFWDNLQTQVWYLVELTLWRLVAQFSKVYGPGDPYNTR